MVSVIIPIYKAEKYLNECIDSVLAQTYEDLEVILVDDGSPDNCGAICDNYAAKDSRVKVIHKENGGPSDARNAGLAITHGEYIYFLDSDDYIVNNAIELLINRAEQENADLVFFNSETFAEDAEDLNYDEDFIRKHSFPTMPGTKMLGVLCKYKCYLPHAPFMFYRSDLIKKNGITFVKGIIHEDESFSPIVILKAARVAQLQKSLYYRRQHAHSITADRFSVESFRCSLIVLKILDKTYSSLEEGSIGKRSLEMAMCMKAHNMVNIASHFSKEQRKIAAPLIKKSFTFFRNHGYFRSFKLKISVRHFKLSSFYITKLRPLIKKYFKK